MIIIYAKNNTTSVIGISAGLADIQLSLAEE